jgi:hypothetical protein
VHCKWSHLTGPDGTAVFEYVPKGDYLLLALYNYSQDFKHMGKKISVKDKWIDGGTMEIQLMVTEKSKGKSKEKSKK